MDFARASAFILIAGCLVFLIARRVRYLIVVRHLIKQAVNPDCLEASDPLQQLNAECKDFTFVAKRAFSILFRKKTIALVDGHAGHTVVNKMGLFWQTNRCLFAVTPLSNTEWFELQNDAFKKAFYGTKYAVFWAKPNGMRKWLTERAT